MANSPVELIKEKLDIVDVLRGYLSLVPAGKNFKGLCPFHKEKTPSFMVSPERQSWRCFGCALGGDMFSFVMRYENIEFGEALRLLAEKAGIELRSVNPLEYKVVGMLYELQEEAKLYFKQALKSAGPVRQYLAERGLTETTIDAFDIGWAPNDQEALTLHLVKRGFGADDIVRAGLAFKTERGMRLDRFRGRIMFPIENHLGKTVGFTGRILPQFDTGQQGKYVNSPETPIFNKSKLLYGYSKTKTAIRDAGFAFLVEGQMDCVMSYQAGVTNVVATSGTALTQDHLRALRRLTDRATISFDTDEAGLVAGERAIDLAEANDFEVRVVLFKGHKDPAEAAQSDPKLFKETVSAARPAPEFYFDRYLPEGPQGSRDRKFVNAIRTVLSKLQHMASPVLRNHWFRELSKRTGIEERVLMEEAAAFEAKKPEMGSTPPDAVHGEPPRAVSRRELLSTQILSALRARSDYAALAGFEVHLAHPYGTILEMLKRGEERSDDAELDERINMVLLRSEPVDDSEVQLLLSHLSSEYAKDRRQELVDDVRRAEAAGDEAAAEKALRELYELLNAQELR